jgi:predicted dehydrogenase
MCHLPVLLSMDNVQVAWLADINNPSAAALARAFGVPHLTLPASPDDLPDCDVVLLAIPVRHRMPYYEALARRGIAVFAEKPLAVSREEHAQIVSLFAPHRLACGYMRRLYANSRLLRRAVREQWFGPLQRLRIREGTRGTRTGVDATHYDDVRAAGGGVLLSLGCHTIDLVLYLTLADSFQVHNRHIDWDDTLDRRVEAGIHLHGVGGHPEAMCEVEYCVSWLDDQENTIELEFPNVTLSAGLTPDATVTIRPHGPESEPVEEFQPGRGATTTYQAFFLEWDHFLRGVDKGEASLVAASTAQNTAALIDAVYGRGADTV